MINVLVVDDQTIMRDGLATILQLEEDINVVGTACNGSEAHILAGKYRPDVVLMDIYMPEVDGVKGTQLIKSEFPEIKVLILTTFNDDDFLVQALDAGASGYLLKEMPAESIVCAILAVAAGGVVLQPAISRQMVTELKKKKLSSLHDASQQKLYNNLTEREKEVFSFLGLGFNNKDIAQKLLISEGTAKIHVANIISKMKLSDRTKAVIFAVKNELAEC